MPDKKAPEPEPTEQPLPDREFERYANELRTRTARLALYLRLRAALGLILILFSAASLALAAAFALTGAGLLEFKALAPWTSGFNAVLSTFMPAALAWLAGATGWNWLRNRHLEAPTQAPQPSEPARPN